MTTTIPALLNTDARLLPISLRRELNELGYHDRAIRRMVDSGELAKPRRGAYTDATTYDHLDASGRHVVKSRAVLRQAKSPAALSHVSALPWYGAPDWGLDLSRVHVTRLDGRAGRREAGVVQHCGSIVEGDLTEHHGTTVTSATRTLLELTTLASVDVCLVQANHLLHTGLTSISQLRTRYEQMEDWPSTLTTDLVLRLGDARIESVGESRCWHLFFTHSIPMPEPQHPVHDGWGQLVAALDFAWPKLRRWVEFDGRIKYEKLLRPGERASDVVVREKRREKLVEDLTGWRCLRLTWDDLKYGAHTAARIRQFLAE